MIPYVLYYDEHYKQFLKQKNLSETIDSFRLFLKEIGTASLLFERPTPDPAVVYHQVPSSTCIRLRTPEEYVAVVHKSLYPELREKGDKSRRSSSCVIV